MSQGGAAGDKAFVGSIPKLYDTYLVPLIFAPYAADLAQRVSASRPLSVLETAAGTGVVTRALAPRLVQDACYMVTDLNQPMIDHASAAQGQDGRIGWRTADALALPFEDGTFDAVICQFGAMFFPDRIKGYREARRVLKPGGCFFFNVWDRIEENDFAATVTDALALMFPEKPPRFLARTPHAYHDIETLRSDLAGAGFADVSNETVSAVSRAASARDPAIAYCQGTPLRGEIEALGANKLGPATDRAETVLAQRFGTGPIVGKIQAHVVTARR